MHFASDKGHAAEIGTDEGCFLEPTALESDTLKASTGKGREIELAVDETHVFELSFEQCGARHATAAQFHAR
jgi:hypothetical protein